jgi:putative methyltransferase (TIGR04325 family)
MVEESDALDMSNSFRSSVRELLPPVIARAWGEWKSRGVDRLRFEGRYATWQEASDASTGYQADEILTRVKEATLKVRSGEAAFERDSVLFDSPEYPFPVIACLLRAAAATGGALNVLDFGGSLGSTYFQCREFFRELRTVRWSIVEQRGFVLCGRECFADSELAFYESIGECMNREAPTVALFSSVLQYIEDPVPILRDVIRRSFPYVIIDQLPVHAGTGDILTVQHVPRHIYPASYPFRVFESGTMEALFRDVYASPVRFDTVKFPALEHQFDAQYTGMLFVRRQSPGRDGNPS